MPVDPSKREEYLEKLVAEYGPEILVDKKRVATAGRIPVVSPMLTWALTGGVPIGHMCRWWGPAGSGKSLTNLGLLAGGQRLPFFVEQRLEYEVKALEKLGGRKLAIMKKKKEARSLLERFPNGMEAILFDTEQRFNFDLAVRMGVDIDRVEIVDDNIIEQICDQAAAACAAFHIIIIDSTSNTQSMAEANLAPGDELRASGPRAWSRLKHIRKAMDRTENVFIIVDQVRTQLGNVNHKGVARVMPPQIRIFDHNTTISVEFQKGTRLYLNDDGLMTDDYKKASRDIRSLGTDGKEPHGLEMRCYVEKNSSGRPYRNARMRFKFPVADVKTGDLIQDAGYDLAFEMLEIGVYFYVIEDAGAGNFYVLDDNFKRTKIHRRGEWNMRQLIEDDEDLRLRILERLHRDMTL